MSEIANIINYSKKLKVLYVEDEEKVRTASLELFENFFESIVVAEDGIEALEYYNRERFDLIITDIAMPKMDGFELIKEIRKKDKFIPIIVFSAFNDSSYLSASITLNVDGYILKPLKVQNLIDLLGQLYYKVAYQFSEKIDATHFKKSFDIDNLTQLKSHSALLERLDTIEDGKTPIFILVNIDEFHVYNEIYGLHIGDRILEKFAKVLKAFSESKNYELYRMSGDEFVIFETTNIIDSDKYSEDIEELVELVETQKMDVESVDEPVVLSITVGIAFGGGSLYSRAEMALLEARKRGRSYLGFSADIDRKTELKNNLYWREEINKAIAQKRVCAFYQPIVDKEKKILKYEALMRIKQIDSEAGEKIIEPAKFLDFSKISKQYVGLTKFVIEDAFKTMLEENVHVAINITFQDVENREINKLLRHKISKHNLASKTKFDISSQVIFELLEHSNHDDYDRFVAFIDEFKELGVIITIDNFGLGFANMSKISAMSPHYVKIDSTLIKNIDSDVHAFTLVKAIVKFAKELGMKTIAEHVSTKEIFELCQKIGIDEFQGYYLSEPKEYLVKEIN